MSPAVSQLHTAVSSTEGVRFAAVLLSLHLKHAEGGRDIGTLQPRSGQTRALCAWLSDLYLMARIAGLGPTEWWSGWDRAVTATSCTLVSVYRRCAGQPGDLLRSDGVL